MADNKMNLSDLLETHRRDRERLAWEGTFRDYFELVTQNPNISKLSHARVCDMVLASGVEKINEGSRDEIVKFNFFSDELFGIERPISKIVEYFKSAGQRLEVRKRILLLMGPVGGGKSTIVTMLKRGLERWSRTGDGAVYAINGAILNAVGRRTAGTVSISIGNASVTEGNTGTANTLFTVSLSAASANTVSVHYASADGTAMAGSDYTAVSGTLTFAPGETSKTISVAVAGDTINEPDETFVVNLSNPSNATIADGQGQATILNDDPPPPSLAIGDVTVNEGNSGVTSAVFSVTLSSASSQTVTVNYASADGSAKVATKDYVAVSGTLTFAPGQTTGTIVVSITGDRKREKDETFFVNLSSPSNATIARGQGRGTIRNDD